MDSVLGWWFGDGSRRLPHGDGRTIVVGDTHTVDTTRIEPCRYGLHASPTVFDALRYAPGPYLFRVRLSGVILPHGDPIDKYAASERAYLDGDDATPLLRWFARVCAAGVLKYWNAPQIVKDYLKTGDESLRDAAWAAAQAAAWDAAEAAAEAAAWAAAEAAAEAAARAAARAAAWDAAEDAARAAAWDAAEAAAWAAAEDIQRKWLEAGALQWFGIEPHALDDLIKATQKSRESNHRRSDNEKSRA